MEFSPTFILFFWIGTCLGYVLQTILLKPYKAKPDWRKCRDLCLINGIILVLLFSLVNMGYSAYYKKYPKPTLNQMVLELEAKK